MSSGIIYKITNPRGSVYIGKTKNLANRLKFYRLLFCKKQTKIYRSILKYGWDNHTVEILHIIPFNEEELNNLEMLCIKKFNSFNTQKGLNLTPGGKFGYISELNRKITRERLTGRGLSEATKQKLREANLGKKQSPETVAKRNAVNTGKKRTDETRQRISEARKGMKFSESHILALKNAVRPPVSDERKEELRQRLKAIRLSGKRGIRVKGKKVVSTIDNKEFVSLKAACDYYGLSYCTTKNQLNGYKGYSTTFLKVA